MALYRRKYVVFITYPSRESGCLGHWLRIERPWGDGHYPGRGGRATGVIDDCIFVSIVVMALATSLMAGPMMHWLLAHRMMVARLALRRANAAPAGE